MKNTIRAYKRRIQQIEVQAADMVDKVFKNPFDLKEKETRQKINALFLRKIKPLQDEALMEGIKFGKHIKQLTKQNFLSYLFSEDVVVKNVAVDILIAYHLK